MTSVLSSLCFVSAVSSALAHSRWLRLKRNGNQRGEKNHPPEVRLVDTRLCYSFDSSNGSLKTKSRLSIKIMALLCRLIERLALSKS